MEQLGRDAGEQKLFSQTRSIYGDLSGPMARAFMDRSRDVSDLQEARQMITDGSTSFVTALRRGATASGALAQAFGSAADKLMSKAIDSVVSAGFGSLTGTGGGGGVGSLLGDIASFKPFPSFFSGRFTGPGDKYEPAGIVHRGEYVIDAATVGRLGRGYFDGLRGYAEGGFVDMPDRSAPIPPAPTAPTAASGVSAPVTIVMQGSSGDPAADRAAADMAGKAASEHVERVTMGVLQRASRPGGALYNSGVRRRAQAILVAAPRIGRRAHF